MTPITTNFREDLRYEYPELTSNSTVIDAGAYHGDFANEIARRYNCRVYAFEPVFYRHCHGTDRITYFPVGLGWATKLTTFKIKGDMTGIYADGTDADVVLLDVADVIADLPLIDLLKLNIEGGEYDVLLRLLDMDLIPCIKNIQVQFHKVGQFGEYEGIRERLLMTHHLTYDFPFCWENYRLNQ